MTNVECVQCACSSWHNSLSLPFIVWRTWIYPIRRTGAFSAILPHPRVAVGRPITLYRWLLKRKSLWVSYWPTYMRVFVLFLGCIFMDIYYVMHGCVSVSRAMGVCCIYWYSSANAEQTGWKGWVTIIWYQFESRSRAPFTNKVSYVVAPVISISIHTWDIRDSEPLAKY